MEIIYQNSINWPISVMETHYVHCRCKQRVCKQYLIYDMIYLLIAIGLTPGSSSTIHICTQTMHRTTQLTTLVGRLPGIRKQNGQNKISDKITA